MQVNKALLTVTDTRTIENDKSGSILVKKIAEQTCKKFPITDLFCRHRIGIIDVGEISLHVVIWSKHRRESLAAMNWFISELKKHVPIWKWAIMIDNTRVPSECEH